VTRGDWAERERGSRTRMLRGGGPVKLAMKRTPPKVRSCPIIPMYKESDPRTGFLEDAQYTPLAMECSKVGLWLRTLLTTAYSFAFRKGELLSIAR
jgi:hypothetical protein